MLTICFGHAGSLVQSACRRAPEAKRRWRSGLVALDGGELRQVAGLSGRPLNHYDALGITVAASGEVQDQARRPCEERAKVGHSLCDHRDVASNLDLHVWGVAVEACSDLGDVLGCVSHSRFPFRRLLRPRHPGHRRGYVAKQALLAKRRLSGNDVASPSGPVARLGQAQRTT